MSYSLYEALKNFPGFLRSWATLPWQLWWAELSFRHHLCCLTSGGWHSSVTGPELLTEAQRVGQGRGVVHEGWRDRKTGKDREEGEGGDSAHWPFGPQCCPNDGCQRCTQVKLKWLRCYGKESSQRRIRIHNEGRTFTGTTGFAQGTHWPWAVWLNIFRKAIFK